MTNNNFRGKVVMVVVVLVVLSVLGRMVQSFGGTSSSSQTIGIEYAEKVANLIDDKKPSIDIDYINVKLQDMGELTTAEMAYDGMLNYQKGKLPLLTKHSFLMTYSSYARAGIDFSKVRVRVSGDTVKVIIPKSEIQLIYVDPESICFYDQNHALFEGDEKEDLKEALIEAEADAKAHLDLDMVLSRADARAELMICDLIEDLAGGVEIEVERR